MRITSGSINNHESVFRVTEGRFCDVDSLESKTGKRFFSFDILSDYEMYGLPKKLVGVEVV